MKKLVIVLVLSQLILGAALVLSQWQLDATQEQLRVANAQADTALAIAHKHKGQFAFGIRF